MYNLDEQQNDISSYFQKIEIEAKELRECNPLSGVRPNYNGYKLGHGEGGGNEKSGGYHNRQVENGGDSYGNSNSNNYGRSNYGSYRDGANSNSYGRSDNDWASSNFGGGSNNKNETQANVNYYQANSGSKNDDWASSNFGGASNNSNAYSGKKDKADDWGASPSTFGTDPAGQNGGSKANGDDSITYYYGNSNNNANKNVANSNQAASAPFDWSSRADDSTLTRNNAAPSKPDDNFGNSNQANNAPDNFDWSANHGSTQSQDFAAPSKPGYDKQADSTPFDWGSRADESTHTRNNVASSKPAFASNDNFGNSSQANNDVSANFDWSANHGGSTQSQDFAAPSKGFNSNANQNNGDQNRAENDGTNRAYSAPVIQEDVDGYQRLDFNRCLLCYNEPGNLKIKHLFLNILNRNDLMAYTMKIMQASCQDKMVLAIQRDNQLAESFAQQLRQRGFWTFEVTNKTQDPEKLLKQHSIYRCGVTTMSYLRDNVDSFQFPSVVINFDHVISHVKFLERFLTYRNPSTAIEQKECFIYEICFNHSTTSQNLKEYVEKQHQ